MIIADSKRKQSGASRVALLGGAVAVLVIAALVIAAAMFGNPAGDGEVHVNTPEDTTKNSAAADSHRTPAVAAATKPAPAREEALAEADASEFNNLDIATFEIAGRIVGIDKKPVGGALVRVYATTAKLPSLTFLEAFRSNGLINFERAKKTNADGKFTFRGPFADGVDFIVAAASREHALATFRPDGVQGGKVCNMGDLVLENGLEIVGTVFDVSGNPLPSARVGVVASPTDASIEKFIEQTEPEDFEASNDQGQFRVPHLTEGRYTLIAWAPGYARAASPPVILTKEKNARPIDIHLAMGDLIQGNVINQDGLGIPGAKVTVRLARKDPNSNAAPEIEDSRFFDFPISVITDAAGEYQIDGLVANMQYQMTATADEHRAASASAAAGQTSVSIVLKPDLQVRGIVMDKETGAPIPRAKIVVFRGKITDLKRGQGSVPIPKTVTDGAGRFLARDDGKTGNATILAWAPGYAPAMSETFQLAESGEIPETKVILERGAMIEGRVVSSATKEGAAAASVSLYFVGDPAAGYSQNFRIGQFATKTTADSQGNYIFEGLLDGFYIVEARHGAYGSVRSETIGVGATDRRSGVELLMPSPAAIKGTVVGAPPNASIRILATRNDGLQFAAFAGAENKFTITKLGAGTYQVRAEKISTYEDVVSGAWRKGTGAGSVPVILKDGDVAEILLEIPDSRIGKLTGTITDAGTAGSGYSLVLVGEAPGAQKPLGGQNPTFGNYKSATADYDGYYEFPAVREGTYRVYAIPRGRSVIPKNAVASESVQIFSNGMARRDLYGQSGTLNGRATRSDGTGIAKAKIIAQVNGTRSPTSALPPGTLFTTTTNKNGWFDFGRVPGGAYDITIEAPGVPRKTVPAEVYGGTGNPVQIRMDPPVKKNDPKPATPNPPPKRR
ncbi:MAG: carboxypeptidase regulatory-like domain-containing protein [Planctomycetota bacterium]